MNYIYCYTNKLNNHKYVGQTNNMSRRIREHRSCAFNKRSLSYNDLIHQKIREYGEENFNIEILEKLYYDDIEKVNDREKYWIKEKKSYCGWGKGYNMTLGGDNKNFSRILSQNSIKEIKELIKNGTTYYDIQYSYGISASFISAINHGTYFYDENETYPLFKYYKSKEDYDDLLDLLLNSTYSLKKISELLGIGYSTVKKINEGRLRKDLYPSYPIRKTSVYGMRAEKVKDLLINTSLTYAQITELTGASDETIRRIRIGESFRDDNLTYPLRNL